MEQKVEMYPLYLEDSTNIFSHFYHMTDEGSKSTMLQMTYI